ncbi:MAG: ThuA domain-containing protein [Candidatus Poribacteria bacterium]|nr:ThuA domain-containing protein [Candidatus Poribacteria bacterium]
MKKVLLIVNGEQPPYGTFAAMFQPLAEDSGQFEVEVSHDRDRLVDASAFDAVALYIGGGTITPEQERGLTAFVNGGGGLLAVHGANAGLGQYDAYIALIGTEFIRHDPLAPFEVTTEDGVDDILPRLNKQFRVVDECYQMKVRTDAPLRYFQYGTWRRERYPLGYVRDYGDGLVFYTALGHDERAFRHPDFQDQLLKGLRYVTKLKDNPPIRIGLVGYGPLFNMGQHHAGMIAQTHGFELAAVCDQDADRLRAATEDQGDGIATFTDAQEMAQSGLIDLGIVIVPHVYHAPVTKILLEAGLHTIIEKPFVVHVSEADELIALAREKGVMLSVYHNRHWDADILTARDALESGIIGDVFSIECHMVGYGAPGQQWRDHKEISGGMLYDMGAHQFEKILQLVPQHDRRGNRINQRATLYGNFIKRMWHASSNEDYCRAYVRFDSGLEAQLVQSNLCAVEKPLWTILGTHGSIVVENFQGDATVTSIMDDGRKMVSSYPTVTNRGWQTYYKNVSDHLLSGLPLLITPEWAKGTIQCIEGCETAARENRLVEVEFDF